MAFRQLADLAHDDDQLLDLSKNAPPDYEPPEYPPRCCFSISADDLAEAGAEEGEPGDTLQFSAMGEVTSIFKGIDNYRIELQIGEFAGEDGKFFELSEPAYICLCGPELEKMDLEPDCERGDLIHLVGEARMESSSSTEWGGDMVALQIVRLSYVEDESDETREAMNG